MATDTAAPQDARAKLRRHIASRSDTALIAAYRLLYTGRDFYALDATERYASAAMTDELGQRHPALAALLDVWADDLETEATHEQIVLGFLDTLA